MANNKKKQLSTKEQILSQNVRTTQGALVGLGGGALLGAGLFANRNKALLKNLFNPATRHRALNEIKINNKTNHPKALLGKILASDMTTTGVVGALAGGVGGMGFHMVKPYTRNGKQVRGFKRKSKGKKKKSNKLRNTLIGLGTVGLVGLGGALAYKKFGVPKNNRALVTRVEALRSSYPQTPAQLQNTIFTPEQADDINDGLSFFTKQIKALNKNNGVQEPKKGIEGFDFEEYDLSSRINKIFRGVDPNPPQQYRNYSVVKDPTVRRLDNGLIDPRDGVYKIISRLSPLSRERLLMSDHIAGNNELAKQLFEGYKLNNEKRVSSGLKALKNLGVIKQGSLQEQNKTVNNAVAGSREVTAGVLKAREIENAERLKKELKYRAQIGDLLKDLYEKTGINELHLERLGIL